MNCQARVARPRVPRARCHREAAWSALDLLRLLLPIAGFSLGWKWGSHCSDTVGLLCGIFGGFLASYLPGALFAILPDRLSATDGGVTVPPVKNLRQRLYEPGCLSPGALLLDLQSRGEDIWQEVGFVLGLLESETSFDRTRGFEALRMAYPELAAQLHGYRTDLPVTDCRERIARLRARIPRPIPPVRMPIKSGVSKES